MKSTSQKFHCDSTNTKVKVTVRHDESSVVHVKFRFGDFEFCVEDYVDDKRFATEFATGDLPFVTKHQGHTEISTCPQGSVSSSYRISNSAMAKICNFLSMVYDYVY